MKLTSESLGYQVCLLVSTTFMLEYMRTYMGAPPVILSTQAKQYDFSMNMLTKNKYTLVCREQSDEENYLLLESSLWSE